MTKESLKKLPSLVNMMDENLAINIVDFISSPLLQHLDLKRNKLVETIRQSTKYVYDNKTSLIKLKEKADRNIIIINGYLKDGSDVEKKQEEIKQICETLGKGYVAKIKSFQKVEEALHVIMDHENSSMELEKLLVDKINANVNLLLI
jgi:DNA-binding transcriptional regulator YhcF (GntR family)